MQSSLIISSDFSSLILVSVYSFGVLAGVLSTENSLPVLLGRPLYSPTAVTARCVSHLDFFFFRVFLFFFDAFSAVFMSRVRDSSL